MKPVYISGGGKFTPSEIRAALDEIRISMGLDDDIVLFGLPIDELESAEDLTIENIIPEKKTVNSSSYTDEDHKIIQFPRIGKKSILNVIASPIETSSIDKNTDLTDEIAIQGDTFDMGSDYEDISEELDESTADDGDAAASITALFKGLPPLAAEPTDKRPSLAQEFGAYLEKEDDPEPQKKAKPFGRKKKSTFNNVLGDLFSFAGMAANDDAEEFKLPDFIKRP